VRVRVRPTQARPKVENRERRGRSAKSAPAKAAPAKAPSATSGDDESPTEPTGEAPNPPKRTPSPAALTPTPTERSTDKESDVSAAAVGAQARQFVEELVAAFGLNGETSLLEDGDDLEVQVDGDDLGLLVGPRGATLLAVQDLARVASQRRLGDHSTRLRVDIGGYRVRRREALIRFAAQVAEEVLRTGSPRALEPMPSSDRKVIHEALLEVDGVATRSEGDDPNRRVIVDPAPPTD
jgi:spoIIIJ-associated protein